MITLQPRGHSVSVPQQRAAEAGQPQDVSGVHGRRQLSEAGQELKAKSRDTASTHWTRFSYTVQQESVALPG